MDRADGKAACCHQETSVNMCSCCNRLEAELADERARVESMVRELEQAQAAELEWQGQRAAMEAQLVDEREGLRRMSEELQRQQERCGALQAEMQAKLDAAMEEIDTLRSAVEVAGRQERAATPGPGSEGKMPGTAVVQPPPPVTEGRTRGQGLKHISNIAHADERDMTELIARLHEKEMVLRCGRSLSRYYGLGEMSSG